MAIRGKKSKSDRSPREPLQKNIEKQKLKDLEHIISIDLGTYLVLVEEGTAQQAAMARQKTRSALLKYGPDMFKLAQEIGDPYPGFVEHFLHSIDDLIHTTGWIDDAQIKECFRATQKLEKAL